MATVRAITRFKMTTGHTNRIRVSVDWETKMIERIKRGIGQARGEACSTRRLGGSTCRVVIHGRSSREAAPQMLPPSLRGPQFVR
ncbi:hypothetical protein ORS3428_07465 [Mesorhizobium sp. ORS 3428]|nr:hypothetical protein ORS3428_07465 [Mesorhizobium sp. ORS 3428]